MQKHPSGGAPLTNLEPAILFSEDRKVIAASPYQMDWNDIRARFATTPYRQAMADKFEAWARLATEALFIEQIWLGGSFCSDKELPNDIDAVLFFRHPRPLFKSEKRDQFLYDNARVFDRALVQEQFGIDLASIAMDISRISLVNFAAYWAMVYSNGPDGTRRAFDSGPEESLPRKEAQRQKILQSPA
jgi:hypothetical protein